MLTVTVINNLLLDGNGKLFDLIFAVNFRLGLQLLLKLGLLVAINICNCDRIKFSCFPKRLCSLNLINLIVNLHLLVVVLQVAIRDDIVVSLGRELDLLASYPL